MKPAAALNRLLEALEELGRREDGALAGGDGVAFLALEKCAAPIADRIAELATGSGPMDPALRKRGQAVVQDRHERNLRLGSLLEATRGEINLLDEARSRARALRPAYLPSHSRVRPTPGFIALG